MDNSIDFVIREMRITHKLSMNLATNLNSSKLAEVPEIYAQLLYNWILDLEEIRSKLNSSFFELTSNPQSEIMADVAFGRTDISKVDDMGKEKNHEQLT